MYASNDATRNSRADNSFDGNGSIPSMPPMLAASMVRPAFSCARRTSFNMLSRESMLFFVAISKAAIARAESRVIATAATLATLVLALVLVLVFMVFIIAILLSARHIGALVY